MSLHTPEASCVCSWVSTCSFAWGHKGVSLCVCVGVSVWCVCAVCIVRCAVQQTGNGQGINCRRTTNIPALFIYILHLSRLQKNKKQTSVERMNTMVDTGKVRQFRTDTKTYSSERENTESLEGKTDGCTERKMKWNSVPHKTTAALVIRQWESHQTALRLGAPPSNGKKQRRGEESEPARGNTRDNLRGQGRGDR